MRALILRKAATKCAYDRGGRDTEKTSMTFTERLGFTVAPSIGGCTHQL